MDVKARHSTLGSLLRSLRSRNGWTLKEMSERTDIPVSTLSTHVDDFCNAAA